MASAYKAAAVGLVALAGCEGTVTADRAEMETGLPAPAVSSCMSAVARQAGDGNVAVLRSTPSAGGREVILGVGEDARAPWRCVATDDGTVSEVASLTDEGML